MLQLQEIPYEILIISSCDSFFAQIAQMNLESIEDIVVIAIDTFICSHFPPALIMQ